MVDSTTTKYFLDGANVIADYDEDNVLLATYLTPGLDNNVSATRSGSTYYYMKDGLGSIRNLVESDEDTANTYDYYAFGKELGSWTENVTNRYTYTAREWDNEAEQYYYRARYYDGEGRFNRRDSAYWQDAWNLYLYVANIPTSLLDPLGLGTRISIQLYKEDPLGDAPLLTDAKGNSQFQVIYDDVQPGEEANGGGTPTTKTIKRSLLWTYANDDPVPSRRGTTTWGSSPYGWHLKVNVEFYGEDQFAKGTITIDQMSLDFKQWNSSSADTTTPPDVEHSVGEIVPGGKDNNEKPWQFEYEVGTQIGHTPRISKTEPKPFHGSGHKGIFLRGTFAQEVSGEMTHSFHIKACPPDEKKKE